MSSKARWGSIPKRTFLDTNAINFFLDHGDTISRLFLLKRITKIKVITE